MDTLSQSTLALKKQYYDRALALLRDTDTTIRDISTIVGIGLHSVRKIAAENGITRPIGRPKRRPVALAESREDKLAVTK